MRNSKLLTYSLLSLFIYILFNNAPLFDGILEKLEKTNGTYAIGYYILIKIAGLFLLLFGIIGLFLFIYELLKSKSNN